MKIMEMHPKSALLGAAALGLVLIAASAVQVTSTQQAPNASPTTSIITAPITIDNPIQVRGIPRAKNMVRIDEGQPYVVPTGRLFVVTGIGLSDPGTAGGSNAEIQVNGTTVWVEALGGGVYFSKSIPPGLVAGGSSTVSVVTGQTTMDAVVLGYLADV